ncbi:MAG: peptidylprolyl isomerase [bacterium]
MKNILIAIGIIIVVIVGGYALIAGNHEETKNTDYYNQTATSTDTNISTATTTLPSTNNTKKMTHATLHTNKGDITIEFSTATPKTVENFTKLAQAGFYNETKFHRVIKGFMNQGGDPLSKDDSKKMMWGTGGPGYEFADEITSTNHNDVGTIAMANAGPNTNGSQFFINVAPNNFLDTKHTVFGKVTKGMDVVTAINNTKTDSSDKPLDPVIIESITLN